jgi:hypothetical protein
MNVVFALGMGLACVVLGGCATPGEPPVDRTAMVCTREYPTGSNLPATRCRTREQMEADQAAARAAGDAIDRSRYGIRAPNQ